MYGVAGEKATGRIKIGRFFTNFADPTIVREIIKQWVAHILGTSNMITGPTTGHFAHSGRIHDVPLGQNNTSYHLWYTDVF